MRTIYIDLRYMRNTVLYTIYSDIENIFHPHNNAKICRHGMDKYFTWYYRHYMPMEIKINSSEHFFFNRINFLQKETTVGRT